MHQPDTVFELTHPARVGILRQARSGAVRHRDIMKASGLAPSEVTRHAGRLMEAGFLRKSRRGGFEITRLGSLMLSRLEDLGFVNFHAGYFERHEVGVLPPGLDIISIMRQCDRNEDTMRTVNSILRIYAEARDWMCCMADEFSDAMVSVHAGKLDHGVGLRLITTAGRRVPSEYSEPAAGGVNARSMKRVPLFMSFSEREALLCLRLQGGGIDYSVSFSSADDAFVGWCATVFDHYWERARDLTL